MEMKGTLLTAVHAASDGLAVTVTEPVPPVAVAVAEVAPRVKVVPAPACMIVNVWPAMVSVPVRLLTEVFATAEYATLPLPVPVAPEVIEIQDALLVAVQVASIAFAVTVTEPVPPFAATLADGGARVKLAVTAACVIVNACPPTEMVPVR